MERNTLIKLFCVIILIALNLAVVINGLNLSCDKCKLIITNNDDVTKTNQEVKIIDLYNHYLNGTCLIERRGNRFVVHGLP